jgi:hypothetical protein
VHLRQGDLGVAEVELRSLLADRTRILGYRHRRTLETRNELAELLVLKGDRPGAIAEYQDVLADRLQLLGNHHPHTIATARALAELNGQTLGGDVA